MKLYKDSVRLINKYMYFNYEHCSPFRMCNVIKARLNVIEQFEPLWRNETTMRFKHNQRFPLHFRPSRNN